MKSEMIMKALDFAYDKAVTGVIGIDSAQTLAESYMRKGGTKRDMVNSLTRWQNAKACTSGFITGIGGFLAMPVTLPANITSVLFVQVRMILAIAIIGGYDVRDDKVKSLVYMCLVGNTAKDILKDITIVAGKKVAIRAIENISEKTIMAINQKVGFKLLAKFGEKGAVNLGKAIPLAGGIIGGGFDLFSTNAIGNLARKTFIEG
ncbi:MAG: EcsC family protein [Flavobacterium sp.]